MLGRLGVGLCCRPGPWLLWGCVEPPREVGARANRSVGSGGHRGPLHPGLPRRLWDTGDCSSPARQPTGPLPSLPQDTKGSVAVRVALGETQLVQEVRRFLLDNGVSLDSFSQVGARLPATGGLGAGLGFGLAAWQWV